MTKNQRVLYILISVWVLHSTNAGWNWLFQQFFVQKAEKGKKKSRKLRQYQAKNVFSEFAPNAGQDFYFQKNSENLFFSGNKPLNQLLSANLKKTFFCLICLNFLPFSAFFHKKLWKCRFWPAFRGCNTQTLVEITKNLINLYILVLFRNVWVTFCVCLGKCLRI